MQFGTEGDVIPVAKLEVRGFYSVKRYVGWANVNMMILHILLWLHLTLGSSNSSSPYSAVPA